MMFQKSLLSFLGICSLTAFAGGLLRNSDFSKETKYGTLPADWSCSTAGQKVYGYVNDDGISDSFSLRYQADEAASCAPAVKKFTCNPNSEYVLTAAIKSDKRLVPEVSVYAEGTSTAAATVNGKYLSWKRLQIPFNSGAATQFEVRLYGDIKNRKAKTIAIGTAWFDDVQIYPADQLPRELAPKPPFKAPGVNLALNKPYKLSPFPGYSYCKDPDDKTQLTDGVYTVGYFWTQKTTVGWSRANPAIITIDLGNVEPIAGLSYSTAAGVAGVAWPSNIFLFTSDDQKIWRFVGDFYRLAIKNGVPSSEKYSRQRFVTDEIKARGRYVKLMVLQKPYTFVDEVEVYRGNDAWLQGPPLHEAIPGDMKEFFVKMKTETGIISRLAHDFQAAKDAITDSNLPPASEAALGAEVKLLSEKLSNYTPEITPDFETVLPLNPLHRRIYALNATLLQARGFRGVSAWKNNRWAPLKPTDAPDSPAPVPSIDIALMRREVRAGSVNFVNADKDEKEINLKLEGLPEGIPVTIRDVLFTDTGSLVPIAAALPHARKNRDQSSSVQIAGGCSKQVWLSVERPAKIAGGNYSARLVATPAGGKAIVIPVNIRIYDLDFPETPTMSMGGWDYTNGSAAYYKAPGNVEKLVPFMLDHYVDTPWATKAVMPSNAEFAEDGTLSNPGALNFANWDEWVQRWEKARKYYVFLSMRDSFYKEKMGTPRFNRMVSTYFTAWADYMKQTGLDPKQLGVLILDEPHANKQDKIIIAWAKAIRAANTGIDIFEDPTYRAPWEGIPEMFEVCTTLCPNTPMMVTQGDKFREFYEAQRDAGRHLWLYSCSGPGKLLDPIDYHRAQMWWGMRIQADGAFYWALGCAGGSGNSWNAYAQKGTEYSPFFVGQTDVVDGKHFEAMREGVQDYEYFVMLKKAAAKHNSAVAKKWLREAPLAATAPIKVGAGRWNTETDWGRLDTLRLQALELLEKLR